MHDTVPLIVRRARHNIGVRKIIVENTYLYTASLSKPRDYKV